MYEFRPSARRRHVVWLMLLSWLFALSTGVVNACALSVPGTAAAGLESGWHAESAWHQGKLYPPKSDAHAQPHEHEATALAQDEHRHDAGKDSCLKFCSDESTALSKHKSAGSDLTVFLVEVGPWYLMAAPTRNVVGGASRERPTSQGPPLVIRFLRLTL